MPATETQKATEIIPGHAAEDTEQRVWEDKEDWTEIRYGIRDPEDFQEGSFRRKAIKTDKPRVIGLFGRLKGEDTLTLAGLRFPKEDGWTLAEAKEWVKNHPDVRSEEWADRPHRVKGVEFRGFSWAELRVEGEDAPRIVGHAAVFDQLTEEMWGFREKIARGAFTKTIKQGDIRFLFNHDPNYVLGRNRSGTLKLAEDEHGLYIEATPPNTPTIRDLVIEPIRRGDVNQMSFSFAPIREEWDTGAKPAIRTLIEVRLFDVSAVTFPAYPGTDVAVRSIAGIEPQLDFDRLAWILAKRDHKLALQAEETEFVQQTITELSRTLPAAPGQAAHPADGTPQASSAMETLRRRLKKAESVCRT